MYDLPSLTVLCSCVGQEGRMHPGPGSWCLGNFWGGSFGPRSHTKPQTLHDVLACSTACTSLTLTMEKCPRIAANLFGYDSTMSEESAESFRPSHSLAVMDMWLGSLDRRTPSSKRRTLIKSSPSLTQHSSYPVVRKRPAILIKHGAGRQTQSADKQVQRLDMTSFAVGEHESRKAGNKETGPCEHICT